MALEEKGKVERYEENRKPIVIASKLCNFNVDTSDLHAAVDAVAVGGEVHPSFQGPVH